MRTALYLRGLSLPMPLAIVPRENVGEWKWRKITVHKHRTQHCSRFPDVMIYRSLRADGLMISMICMIELMLPVGSRIICMISWWRVPRGLDLCMYTDRLHKTSHSGRLGSTLSTCRSLRNLMLWSAPGSFLGLCTSCSATPPINSAENTNDRMYVLKKRFHV